MKRERWEVANREVGVLYVWKNGLRNLFEFFSHFITARGPLIEISLTHAAPVRRCLSTITRFFTQQNTNLSRKLQLNTANADPERTR